MAEKRFKKRVLVFPCGTEIGLEIHRALCHSTHVELMGANSIEPNHGAYVFRNYFAPLPMVYDPLFLPELSRLVREHLVDFVYPAHDDVLLALSRHADALDCEVIGAPKATCELCRSKAATYARFSGVLPVPRIHSPADSEAVFPLFLKPDRGQGSRGARQVHSVEEWKLALQGDPTLIAMNYLPGTEYTVDCFTDRMGALRFAGARERVRTQGGISVHARPVDDACLADAARRINEVLELRGAWFFQMKRDAQGRPVLLEEAPRVSGGMGLYRNLGVNLPLLSVYDRAGLDVEMTAMQCDIAMDRALMARFNLGITYEHVYVDLDDTLLRATGVDPFLAAFLFQCRNKGRKLHLLTRHAGNLTETLAQHALLPLFDTVTLLEPDTKKSVHMAERPGIFIDDSFAERKEVQDALGIPVFAPDAVEALIDWRR